MFVCKLPSGKERATTTNKALYNNFMVDFDIRSTLYTTIRARPPKGPSIKDVRKGGGVVKSGRGGGLGKCKRPQNFGNFPQNSIKILIKKLLKFHIHDIMNNTAIESHCNTENRI